MPTFGNLSHRRRLQELGILRPDEITISAQELVQRLLAHQTVLDEALYIIQQDIAQPLSVYGMVESLLEMTLASVEAIHDQTSLESALQDMQQVVQLSQRSYQMGEDFLEFARSFDEAALLEGFLPSKASQEAIRNLVQQAEHLLRVAAAKQPLINQTLQQAYQGLEEKIAHLKP